MTRLDRWEQRTGPWLTGLALLSFMTLVLDALTETDSTSVRVIDYTAWATFAADYMVRLYLAEHRWSFVQSHPLDLAAVALPALRVFFIRAIPPHRARRRRAHSERWATPVRTSC